MISMFDHYQQNPLRVRERKKQHGERERLMKARERDRENGLNRLNQRFFSSTIQPIKSHAFLTILGW